LSYESVDSQPMAILHQYVSGVTELGFLALTLARQQPLGIGAGLVRFVAAPFAMNANARIAVYTARASAAVIGSSGRPIADRRS
jgi:hypothetical protein